VRQWKWREAGMLFLLLAANYGLNVISFRSRIVVLVNWAWDYLFYDRPIRLILRAAGEKAARPK